MTITADQVESSYLGYPLVIADAYVTVLDPDGRRLFRTTGEISTVRRFIRGHRAATQEITEPARLLAKGDGPAPTGMESRS